MWNTYETSTVTLYTPVHVDASNVSSHSWIRLDRCHVHPVIRKNFSFLFFIPPLRRGRRGGRPPVNHEKDPQQVFFPSPPPDGPNPPIKRFHSWENLVSRPIARQTSPFRGVSVTFRKIGGDGLEKFQPRAFSFFDFYCPPRTRKSGPTDARFAPFPFSLPPPSSLFSLFIVFNTFYSYLLFFFLLFFFFFFFFLFLVNREDTLKRFKGMSDFLVGQERGFIDDDLNFKPKTNMLMGGDSFFGRHFFSGSRGTVSIQTGFWTMNMYLESFLLFPRRLCWVSIDVENILAQSNSDFSARDWKMVFLPLKNFSFADFWHFVIDKIVNTLLKMFIRLICSILMVFFLILGDYFKKTIILSLYR